MGGRLRYRRGFQDAQACRRARPQTDRRDAHFLAVQLALGVVAEVHVPDSECEGARDDTVRAKQHLQKFLLRHDYVYDEKNAADQRKNRWTRDFWVWVGRVNLGDSSAMATLDHYCECVCRAGAKKSALEAKVKALAQTPGGIRPATR